jgi:uncharacterized protein (DUF2062 family)
MQMAKKLFKQYLPHPDIIIRNRWIKLLGPRLQDPSLWHINRRSCSGGLAVGVFFAFVPLPFQMLLAAITAIWLRVNILVAVPTVWLSNPLTMPPMFYFCYLVGALLLDSQPGEFNFELSFDWLLTGLNAIWQPFLLGCLVVATVASLVSFILARILWRLHVLSHIKERRLRRKNSRKTKP